jgi:uncharacterized membrane protein
VFLPGKGMSSFVAPPFLLKFAHLFERIWLVGTGGFMKLMQNRIFLLITALMAVMALTRFNHFGSSVSLPDASWALFFLGGLYMGRVRAALAIFAVMVIEAALIDYYAITQQDVSAWCVTNAYGFMVFAYAALWFSGRWFASHHTYSAKCLLGLLASVATASMAAFLISNVSFYLFSGRYTDMGAAEYATRVVQYFGSYIAVTLMYVVLAVAVDMVLKLIRKGHADQNSRAV